MSFTNKTILITGSGQGIGRAYALAFAECGANVVVADINIENAQNVVNEIQSLGQLAMSVYVDISSEEAVKHMISEIVNKFGAIDVLVNNAALFSALKMKPYDQITTAEWDQMFAINTRGTFICCREVAAVMRKRNQGRIINISSGVVDDGRPNYLHYLSSKAAVNGMTRGLATELGEFGITVNTISPYGIATEVPRETISSMQWEAIIAKQAIHVKGDSQAMVGAVLFLASEQASFITGQTLHVNGGTIYH